MSTTGNILVFFRGSIPDWISIIVANVLIVSSTFILLIGFEKFVGKKGIQVQNYILILIFFLVHTYFFLIKPDLNIRSLNLSFAYVVLSFQIAYLMLKKTPMVMRKITRPVGIVFSGVFVNQIMHFFFILQRDSSIRNYFNSEPTEAFYLVVWEITIILLAYSIILMYNKRLILNLNVQEEKFSKAFHEAPFIIMLSKLDDGKVFEVNKSVHSIAGYQPSELISYKTTDLRIWKQNNDRHQFISELNSEGKVIENEYLFRKKSGELFTGLISANIIEINKERCIISVITDISERKLAQHKFQMLFEQSPVGLVLVDYETQTFLEVNNSVLASTGYTRKEFLHLDYWDLVPVEYKEQETKQFQTLNETGRFGLSFKEYIRKDGSRYPLSESGAYFIDTNGRKVVWIIIEDLSERRERELIIKKQNDELQKLNATKDKFFSIIAHDLKGPFNGISGLSQILIEQIRNKDYEGIEEYAEFIHSTSQQAINLLINLLEWSRLQTGQMEFNPEFIEVTGIISPVKELLSISAQQKSIQITLNFPDRLTIYADKFMLETIFRNLIANAIKFTPKNGNILVSAEENENEFLFVIEDNGIGIEKKNLEKLFRIGENLSSIGTENETGTGLGLILCNDFIQKHKGKIWVESERGIGSKFYFSLPKV
jgi:PAS domain S-box-containing protein